MKNLENKIKEENRTANKVNENILFQKVTNT
jgi:hypothetical protein